MKIAIISDFNIAGIPTHLMRAINKYTKHEARCIIAYDDSFAYDKDILLSKDKQEATAWVGMCDFFHFGRGIFNWEGINWNDILTKDNCCIEYYGSELRENWPKFAKFHEKTGIAAITGTDWTITGRLPNSFYHLGQYFTKFGDMAEKEIPRSISYFGDGNFKIAISSAGSPLKGYDRLYQTIKELEAEGVPVELVHLTGMTNSEVLEKKANCHATFTSIHGGWGMSGVESMFLGHPIICSLDPWVMSLYPNSPTVVVSKATLKEKIKGLVENRMICRKISVDSRLFALREFNTKTILKRYLYLWDLIRNREIIMEGGHNPTIIYDNF